MDRLQADIAALVVAADTDAGVSPRSTHAAIRQLTRQRPLMRAGLSWPGCRYGAPADNAAAHRRG